MPVTLASMFVVLLFMYFRIGKVTVSRSLKSIDIHHLKNTKLVKTYFPLPHTPVINTTTIMGDVAI